MRRARARAAPPVPTPTAARSPVAARARTAAGTARAAAAGLAGVALTLATAIPAPAQGRPNKPVLHGKHWVAITGKPLGATAGAMIFQRGGNAVDAACAMLAATSTMWDVLSWGGETQALIYDPNQRKVIGINALGVAPTGATPEFFREKGMRYPPEFGPLAAVTPGTPGGLLTMLAEYGTLSLAEVLAPAIQMADGYPIEAQTADRIEEEKERIKEWKYSREVFLPHLGAEGREAPSAGEVFRQPDLARTLRKLVEAEERALAEGKSREEAIRAAYDRFYRGDIAEELVRGVQEEGGLITMEDLDRWQVHIEEPLHVNYKGIDVYKLTSWVQSPVMLQMLNMLENFDLKSMGYNSARYIHTVTQAMQLAFADRDFYYGDPYFPPDEPLEGLLSEAYAKERIRLIDPERNDPDVKPGNPYEFQAGEHPFLDHLEAWPPEKAGTDEPVAAGGTVGMAASDASSRSLASGGGSAPPPSRAEGDAPRRDPLPGGRSIRPGEDPDPELGDYFRGTTSIQAADTTGWVVSITPSGGWVPAVIAGETGIGLSQRMQSFVTDPAENPYNVVEPGKRPRATLTPTLTLKDGEPFLSFAVQGGDGQDQNSLQFFLDVVEFGMDVQEAVEAANFNTFQLRNSFGDHEIEPGRLMVQSDTPPWVREELEAMGYDLVLRDRTSGPLNAIWFDREHGTMWGGSSDHGEDYGIAW